MSSRLRTTPYCTTLFLIMCSFCWGPQSVKAGSAAAPQRSASSHGMNNNRQPSLQQEQLELQKQELQVQQQWRDLQEQQLEAQKQMLHLQTEQQQRRLGLLDRFWQILPSIITALMALVVGLIVLNFNHWSTRRSARQDHIRMLMDIDSRLIERPYLWTVYGHRPEAIEGKDDALKQLLTDTKNYRELQEDALMYAFFNMFEAVFDFHRHLGFFWLAAGAASNCLKTNVLVGPTKSGSTIQRVVGQIRQ